MRRWHAWRAIGAVLAMVVALGTSGIVVAQEDDSETDSQQQNRQQLQALDEAFQELADSFYQRYLGKTAAEPLQGAQLDPSARPQQQVAQVTDIRANLGDLLKQHRAPLFNQVLAILYRANDTATIQKITNWLNENGDPVSRSQNYFLLAKYYRQRQNWKGVVAALKQVNLKDLSIADAHYADLLQGYALQGQKKHREAAKYYQHVPAGSPYFPHAKLNEGLAYLRQGWWSESQLEIEKALDALAKLPNQDFKNRLLVVLGFSQIQYEFYRDARNTLRQVALDSVHTKKALIGLGVAAAFVNDYSGALNAFSRVTESVENDLNKDEAFLLVPKIHEEMNNNDAALSAYEQAIVYYESRLRALSEAKQQLRGDNSQSIPALLAGFAARADELYGDPNPIPDYILDNYFMLVEMRARGADLKVPYAPLEQRYESHLKNLVETNIGKRESILASYLSQARYGVAQLYDQS